MRDDDIHLNRRQPQRHLSAPHERKPVHRDEDMVFRRRQSRTTPSPHVGADRDE